MSQVEKERARIVDFICATGDCLHLREQQRVPLPPAGKFVVLQSGILAVDATPTKDKLQVVDFLVPGDIVSAGSVLPVPSFSFRAINKASLVAVEPPATNLAVASEDYWSFVLGQYANQMSRLNVHQLLIGHLETEQRVASFILSMALRSASRGVNDALIDLPMSRTDIANYLVINCDTLSRTMMRLAECGLIERKSRHAIRVMDLDALRKKTPLASLLSAVFDKGAVVRSTSVGIKYCVEKSSAVPVGNGQFPIPVVSGAMKSEAFAVR